ncbi:hypothetical protein ACHHYP_20207 [Achlya hypogyna]|uniref:Uncharacterized protein n=1 Tax=Achlya hypogyna TaxID=1202772 RepID=A0A1V9YXX5_ACHHY|nr:hypothetical protein ACHHYP_20207 [Achlya hypogyna]
MCIRHLWHQFAWVAPSNVAAAGVDRLLLNFVHDKVISLQLFTPECLGSLGLRPTFQVWEDRHRHPMLRVVQNVHHISFLQAWLSPGAALVAIAYRTLSIDIDISPLCSDSTDGIKFTAGASTFLAQHVLALIPSIAHSRHDTSTCIVLMVG